MYDRTSKRGSTSFSECAPRVERRAEVRSRDLAPPDDDLASVEAPQLLLCEPDAVRLAVNAHQHPLGATRASSSSQRRCVSTGRWVEDRQRIDEVEGVVGVWKRRLRPVHLEYAEGKVLAAPANQRRVEVGSWISAGRSRHHRITRPHPQPKSRIEPIDSSGTGTASRIDCAAAGRRRETSRPRNPRDHQPKSRGRQREPVVGRPARPRTARSASYPR